MKPIRNRTIEIWLGCCLVSVSVVVFYWFAKQVRPSSRQAEKPRPVMYYFATNQNGKVSQWASADGTNWTPITNPMRVPPTNWVRLPHVVVFTLDK